MKKLYRKNMLEFIQMYFLWRFLSPKLCISIRNNHFFILAAKHFLQIPQVTHLDFFLMNTHHSSSHPTAGCGGFPSAFGTFDGRCNRKWRKHSENSWFLQPVFSGSLTRLSINSHKLITGSGWSRFQLKGILFSAARLRTHSGTRRTAASDHNRTH